MYICNGAYSKFHLVDLKVLLQMLLQVRFGFLWVWIEGFRLVGDCAEYKYPNWFDVKGVGRRFGISVGISLAFDISYSSSTNYLGDRNGGRCYTYAYISH